MSSRGYRLILQKGDHLVHGLPSFKQGRQTIEFRRVHDYIEKRLETVNNLTPQKTEWAERFKKQQRWCRHAAPIDERRHFP